MKTSLFDGGRDFTYSKMVKKYLPRSLFGRILLIILLPIILVQLLSTYFFLERHWDTVSRRLATSLANDIEVLMIMEPTQSERLQKTLNVRMQRVEISWDNLPSTSKPFGYPALKKELQNRFNIPFYVTNSGKDNLVIYLQTEKGIYSFTVNHKRLYSITVYLYILISSLTAILLAAIAILFTRNQIRPIRGLAKAMMQFGRTYQVVPLKPSGAREIQLATAAFNRMQQRIKNQVEERTFMLAGISHDLRTPIARMKLELSMLPKETSKNFQADLGEMEQLISSYIQFVEAGKHAEKQQVDLKELLQQAISDTVGENTCKVNLKDDSNVLLYVEEGSIKRCFINILSNACRYGQLVEVNVLKQRDCVVLRFYNDGQPIPEAEQEKIFQPFYSSDASHQQGAGLGLAICKDIIERHGGKIYVDNTLQPNGTTIVVELYNIPE